MRILYLPLIAAASAQAGMIATVMAETGLPGITPVTTCNATFVLSPPFDRACTASNSFVPSRPAYAEVAASSPMHLFLETIAGVSGVGCTPNDGCPSAFASISYSDVWTVDGGTGPGTLLLNYSGSARGGAPFDSVVQGVRQQGILATLIPFVYGQPFLVSLTVNLYDPGDRGYSTSTLYVDGAPTYFEGICTNFGSCFTLPQVAGVVTAGAGGDPFVPLPEPATGVIGTGLIAVLLYRAKAL